MAIVNTDGMLISSYTSGGSTYALTSTLDAAGEFWGVIMQIPKTGTLEKIGIRTYSPVTTGDTIRVSIEEVDASTGRPNIGTLKYANATGTAAITTGSVHTVFYVPLNGGAGVSVTQGDLVAIRISYDSYVAGNMSFVRGLSGCCCNYDLPYTFEYVNSAWSAFNNNPANIALSYSDGIAYSPSMFPAVYTQVSDWQQSATYNVRGNRFKLPYKAEVSGLLVPVKNATDTTITLYASNGVDVLKSITLDKDIKRASSSYGIMTCLFDSNVTLNADTYYRITAYPAIAGTNITIPFLTVTDDDSRAALSGLPLGTNMHYTYCSGTPSSESSWTNSNNQVLLGVMPLISGIDIPSGSGSGGGISKARVVNSGGI